MRMRWIIGFIFLFSVSPGWGQDTTRLSLLFFGDIMQHDSQIAAAYDAKSKSYDYSDCFRFVKPYFKSVDLTIGNLELTLGGPPYKGYPQFSAPDQLAKALKESGVDILVTANNHSVDRRKKGIERTIQMLDSMQILHTGTFQDTVNRMNDYPLLVKMNGILIALLNYTYGTNGIPVPSGSVVNLIDTTLIRKDLALTAEYKPDATIVFMHWGLEYQRIQSIQQEKLAEFCFDQGATMVIGSHPHVIQPMKWYKKNNRLVAYSLGNFVSGQRDRFKNGGAMVRVELEKITQDSISVTRIDSAAYILEWVYRTVDVNRDYYVLPVEEFESDNTGFIKDKYSQSALTQFIKDSRTFLAENNLGIPEWKWPAKADIKLRPVTDSSIVAESIHIECPQPEACKLKPNPGSCRAGIIRYYYDQVEKRCKAFLWGGCGGVVPFKTLEECRACECNEKK